MDAAWSVKAAARSGVFPTARRERLEQHLPWARRETAGSYG